MYQDKIKANYDLNHDAVKPLLSIIKMADDFKGTRFEVQFTQYEKQPARSHPNAWHQEYSLAIVFKGEVVALSQRTISDDMVDRSVLNVEVLITKELVADVIGTMFILGMMRALELKEQHEAQYQEEIHQIEPMEVESANIIEKLLAATTNKRNKIDD